MYSEYTDKKFRSEGHFYRSRQNCKGGICKILSDLFVNAPQR